MFNPIRQYALPIIGSQFVALLVLGYLFYGSYTQWEVETNTERDTTIVTKTDTVWGGFDFEFDLGNLEPDSVITKTKRDTVVKDSLVYVNTQPGVKLYDEPFTKTLSTGGTVTGRVQSRVSGRLLNQKVSLSATLPTITEYKTETITETITKTQVGKWRVVASADAFFGPDGVEILAPGIGLQRPTEFSLFYKYDVMNGYHGASVNVPISLIF